MMAGHVVKRGTRLVSSLQPGLSTRCTYTTGQEVALWPIKVDSVGYFQDRSALAAAGMRSDRRCGGESALRITIQRAGKGFLNELDLDSARPLFCRTAQGGHHIRHAVRRHCSRLGHASKARPIRLTALAANPRWSASTMPKPCCRARAPTFEGYRLLREYFLMPERFHFARVRGMQAGGSRQIRGGLDIIFLFRRPAPEMSDITAADFELFATPIINLFERECNVIEIDRRKTRQVLHADRTRPRDFEIYRVTRVEDADIEGPEADVPALFSLGQNRGSGWVYSTERRPRRPGEDERRQGMTRTTYPGDDVFLAISRPAGRPDAAPDQAPRHRRAVHQSRPADSRRHADADAGERRSGRNGAADGRRAASPAGTGGRFAGGRGRRVARRRTGLADGGAAIAEFSQPCGGRARRRPAACPARPLCRSRRSGRRAPCAVDRPHRVRGRRSNGCRSPVRCASAEGSKSRSMSTSRWCPGKARFCCRRCCRACLRVTAGINGFVRTRTRLLQKQEDVPWPMTPGNRHLI